MQKKTAVDGDRATQMRLWPMSDPPAPHRKRASRERKARMSPAPRPESPEERAVRQRLQERFSAKVGLKHSQGRGSFTVHFASYDELDEIMRRIHA